MADLSSPYELVVRIKSLESLKRSKTEAGTLYSSDRPGTSVKSQALSSPGSMRRIKPWASVRAAA